jgi:hypothetical protein
MVLNYEESEGQKHTGLSFVDEPDPPIDENTEILNLPSQQRRAKWRELYRNNKPQERVYLGRTMDRSSALELKDAQGRDRVLIKVTADGTPSLQFLDDQGKVIEQFPKDTR